MKTNNYNLLSKVQYIYTHVTVTVNNTGLEQSLVDVSEETKSLNEQLKKKDDKIKHLVEDSKSNVQQYTYTQYNCCTDRNYRAIGERERDERRYYCIS